MPMKTNGNPHNSALTAWILKSGKTFRYWAGEIGVSVYTLYRWADGSRAIKAEYAQKLIEISQAQPRHRERLSLEKLVSIRTSYLERKE